VKQRWLVSVDLPIEADSAEQAVAAFWAYVRELGPEELPVYVAPHGDETAMRPFLGSAVTNLDPEAD
jgi:hypothetical protein